tara:strand:+ start:453 stop:1766 length:1314 start_codon:yes stop_codon:yes gene_type:complete
MGHAENIYKIYLECNQNVCIDSRSNSIKNSIFFAIKGDQFDGNNFVNEALKKGAKYAFVNADYPINNNSNNIIKVKNTISCLQELATKHRKKWGNKQKNIIGITGTNGKTTTKELLQQLISSQKKVCYTQGNFNNHIGVPLTILRLREQHNLGIIELGANHQGEIRELCTIAQPTHGIITNIGEAHLEGFGSFKNIIKTKNELYDYIKKNDGHLFINSLDPLLLQLAGDYKKTTYYNAVDNTNTNQKNELTFTCNPFIKLYWNQQIIKTKIIGSYNANNIAASIKIATFFNIHINNIVQKLENIEFTNNRSQFITTQKNTIILDAYNANPTSVQLAIQNFLKLNKNNPMIILGDMLELGPSSIEYHQNIVQLLEKYNVQNCILLGDFFQQTVSVQDYQKFNSIKELQNHIKNNPIEERFILIKGSRKLELEKIVPYL